MLTESQSQSIERLENEIVRRIEQLANPDTQSLRGIRREFSKKLSDCPPQFVISLALKLVRSGSVPRFIAYELVQNNAAAIKDLNAASLQELGKGIASWVAVDCFACYVSGPAWREDSIPDKVPMSWAKSPDRWWRRAALVSTVPLNSKTRGGRGDTDKTIKICSMLVQDRDDMVVKALSWALRELSKRDPKAVRTFLAENRSQLAPRVLREVNNKLQTGLKNPRRI